MKKIKVTITQEFELPDECTIVPGPGGKLIKYGNIYLNPEIEFMQTDLFSEKEMHFDELSEKTADMLFRALLSENGDISET